MRKTFVVLASLSLAFGVGGCESDQVQGVRTDIQLDPKELDFGIVYLGRRAEVAISIVNRGGAAGTMEFQELPDGFVVRPSVLQVSGHGTDFLKVEFAPEVEGEFDTALAYRVGDKLFSIPVRARALEAPYAVPEILDFGVVRMGTEEVQHLSIANRLEVGLVVTLRGATALTAATYRLPPDEIHIGPLDTVEVPIVFRPSGEGGKQHGLIEIRCDGCPTKEVVLRGEGAEVQLSFDPDPIVFDDVQPGETQELPVRVENVGQVFSGEIRFDLEKAKRFSVEPETLSDLGPGEWGRIFVRYTAPMDFIKDQEEMRVIVDDRRRVATVPLVATVLGTELLLRGPKTDVISPVGWHGTTPYAWRIEVMNIGTRDEVVLTTELRGADADAFQVVPLDDGVAIVGQDEPFLLLFHPKRAGRHEATLHVSGDDRERTLALEGWGNLPIARCMDVDPVVQVGRPVDLKGWDESRLANSQCKWMVREAPMGSSRKPRSGTACTTDFTPDLVGDYELEFVLTDAAGNTDRCLRSFEARPFQDLWVELFWENPSDVDLYLLNLNYPLTDPEVREHWHSIASCFYANCKSINTPLPWGDDKENRPMLDVDDLDGTGPENITIESVPPQGSYSFGVHWFDRKGQFSTDATVNVYCNGNRRGSTTVKLNAHKLFYRLGTIQFVDGDCLVEIDERPWPGFGVSTP